MKNKTLVDYQPVNNIYSKKGETSLKDFSVSDLEDYSSTFHLNEVESFARLSLDSYKVRYNNRNCVMVEIRIKYNNSIMDLIQELKSFTSGSDSTVNFIEPTLVEVYDQNVYTHFIINNPETNVFETSGSTSIKVLVYAQISAAQHIYTTLKTKYKREGPEVSWSYRDSEGSLRQSYFSLNTQKSFYPEFYPFISDPQTLGRRFLNSEANVLIFLGPPGTGKTSLIRNMLVSLNVGAMTTFDPAIMSMDRFYISYLNSTYNFVVLEDSDILLTNRETDDNRVMSKILNTSDGLVSTKDKKFIFSANLTQESKIDEAMIRPGRCFEVIKFRELSNTEAVNAGRLINVNIPVDDKTYTLSEIFNAKKRKVQRMGF